MPISRVPGAHIRQHDIHDANTAYRECDRRYQQQDQGQGICDRGRGTQQFGQCLCRIDRGALVAGLDDLQDPFTGQFNIAGVPNGKENHFDVIGARKVARDGVGIRMV